MKVTKGAYSVQGQIEKLALLIQNAGTIVFFGGAGVSTESGLSDFRSEKAQRETYRRFGMHAEQILSHEFFMEHPDVFYAYYRDFLLAPAKPNAAHEALVRLEKRGKLNAVITQNIDGLHESAGSSHVLALHGSIHWNHCLSCARYYDAAWMRAQKGVPVCEKCGGRIKPDVVLYGEPLDDAIWRAAKACMFAADTLIVGGTSLSVYPAASLLEFFMGKHLILINQTPTPIDDMAALVVREPIGQVLSRAVL